MYIQTYMEQSMVFRIVTLSLGLLLTGVCISTKYIAWWRIADMFINMMRECEVMNRILFHSSLLRVDDVRLKALPIAARFSPLCDPVLLMMSYIQFLNTHPYNLRVDISLNQTLSW